MSDASKSTSGSSTSPSELPKAASLEEAWRRPGTFATFRVHLGDHEAGKGASSGPTQTGRYPAMVAVTDTRGSSCEAVLIATTVDIQ